MGFSAILDFFSIAAFVPLIASIVNPDIISGTSVIARSYEYFAFTSHSTFVLTISGGALVFVLFKNIVSIWIAKVKARFAFGIRSDMSARALMRYMNNSFIEFTKEDYTRQLNVIANYPLSFANNIILPIATIISEGLVTIFVMACIAFYDPQVLFVVSILLIPIAIFSRTWRKVIKNVSNEAKRDVSANA